MTDPTDPVPPAVDPADQTVVQTGTPAAVTESAGPPDPMPEDLNAPSLPVEGDKGDADKGDTGGDPPGGGD